MSFKGDSSKDVHQDWTNDSVGLLAELPGTSKRVSWLTEVTAGEKVDSSRQYKNVKLNTSKKSHLSAEYGNINGIPVIPLPARYKPWDLKNAQLSISGSLKQSGNGHQCARFNKPPPPPGRPKSPTCAPTLRSRQQHNQLKLDDITGTPNYGWIKYMDPSSGWPYYYNKFTNQSTYDKPPVYQSPRAADKEHDMVSIESPETAEDMKSFYSLLDDLWVEYWDEEVEAIYYYNQLTGEASWVNPDSVTTDNSVP